MNKYRQGRKTLVHFGEREGEPVLHKEKSPTAADK